jgi:hypothetical protein
VFGKRKRGEDETDREADDGTERRGLTPEEQAVVDAEILQRQAEADRRERARRRPEGPWDAQDAPAIEGANLDLGGLQIPLPAEVEVRVDLSPEGQVMAATLVDGESSVQVMAFAAPRSEGIWDEVREEIAASVVSGGGGSEVVEGPLGSELLAQVPVELTDGSRALADSRFVGVDGPRWFLRGLFSGPAARDRAAAAVLEQAFRNVVVVRGGDPMAVRDPLVLQLPPDVEQARVAAAEQAAHQEAQQQSSGRERPERGPESTETR